MTIYCYDTEFIDDGHTIALISIGIVCEDGREYYAVNSEMETDRVKKDPWLLANVWVHLPLRGFKRKSATVAGKIRHVIDEPGYLDTNSTVVRPKWVIANEVREFLLASILPAEPSGTDGIDGLPERGHPELWAYYAAYDHVALAQLWGRMVNLPKGVPMYTRDIKQEMVRLGVPSSAVPQPDNAHDALADARWNMAMLTHLQGVTA